MLTPFRGLRTKLSHAHDRAEVTLRVARRTGQLWNLTLPGLRETLRAMLQSQPNPTQVYRVHAAASPERIAVRCGDDSRTFRELDSRIDSLAHGLAQRGFGFGESVLVMMRNRIEFLEMQAAAARIGSAAVSISWRSTPSELVYLASHCGAKGIAFDADLWPIVEAAWQELPRIEASNLFAVGESPPARSMPYEKLFTRGLGPFRARGKSDAEASVVIYTSGTTGKPKGAVRKFPKDALTQALRFIGETPMRVDDVHLVACPMYHSTAFGFASLSQMIGATLVLLPEFRPEALVQAVERYQVTSTAVVPTMLHRVLSMGRSALAGYQTSSLRLVFSGGAPLAPGLARDFMDQFGDILWNFYGATETGLVTLASPTDLREAPGTIGRAVPGNEIRLLGEDERLVREGSVGELYVRNPLLVAGYHRDEGATQGSMREGFFSVGDLARRDGSGRYFLEGRKRDMIISGGVNVYPAEIELVLESHEDVLEATVVGVVDAEWGERVRAFVVPRPGRHLEPGEIIAFCRKKLAGPKVPREVRMLEALPRNPTGKVLKRELRLA